MSVIGNANTNAPAVKLKSPGDSVGGRITDFEDYQTKDFQTGELRFFEKSGDPIMGTKITLEVSPGNPSSAVTLWAEKVNMIKAIATALRNAGANDLEIGGDLAVTLSGYEGRAHAFQAAYSRPE